MTTQSTRLQLWPRGTTIEFRGDPNGTDCEVRDGEQWRTATDAERRGIRIEQTAERLADREIYCCDSSLVGDLLTLSSEGTHLGGEFSYDNVSEGGWRRIAITAIDNEEIDGLDDYRDAVRDNDEYAEIYEWWRVSKWLASKLSEVGECVLDNNYGQWWGRRTTGQGYLMDGVLQKVAANIDRS